MDAFTGELLQVGNELFLSGALRAIKHDVDLNARNHSTNEISRHAVLGAYAVDGLADLLIAAGIQLANDVVSRSFRQTALLEAFDDHPEHQRFHEHKRIVQGEGFGRGDEDTDICRGKKIENVFIDAGAEVEQYVLGIVGPETAEEVLLLLLCEQDFFDRIVGAADELQFW